MKFNHRYFFFIFASLLASNIYSQTVSGKVLTASQEAIPYATVQIGESYGVITNEEGLFSIKTNDFDDNEMVRISCLGYESVDLKLINFKSQDYTLKEKVNELSEVFITNKPLSVDSIMFYVNAKLKENYRFHLNEFKIFSRKTEYIVGENADFEITKSTGFRKKQLELFNTDFDKLETSLLNNNSKQYTDFIGSLMILDDSQAKLKVEKAIRLLDERNNQSLESLAEKGNDIVLKHLDKDKIYTVKTGLFKISDSVSLDNREDKMADTINSLGHIRTKSFEMIMNNALNNSNNRLDFISETKKYNYELKDVTFIDDEMVYIIDFKPKRSSVKYTGTIYVSNETFAVIRADYRFYKNRVGEKLNLRLLFGVKYVEKNQEGIVAFKKDDDGYYYPSFINEQIDRYFYINRPFKFIENSNTSNKVSFSFKIEGTFKEKTELLILSRNEIETSTFNSYKELKDVDYETPKTYDASIWSDYNVIEPLNEMKDFKIPVEEY
ncbi:carboxypeptidase-like regulatory domain-containing protein [Lacinutrix iliipiscaria]|uniref:Carboxypeptidase-like regulatory domain-containing protein n=1 Tax=Lacinutrix iliipiscaria TaxID=1230532 RepID=A0ABW5WQ50_9FLAO